MIQFDDNDGVAFGQRALGAPQDLEVETVDVDLQAVDALDPMPGDEIVERVEGIGLDLAVRPPQAEDPVLALTRRRRQGDLVDLGIADPVVPKIGPQHLSRGGRFEGEHASRRCELRKKDRVIADIRADIEHPPVGAHVIDEPPFRLELAVG